jgi:hypothetical protein
MRRIDVQALGGWWTCPAGRGATGGASGVRWALRRRSGWPVVTHPRIRRARWSGGRPDLDALQVTAASVLRKSLRPPQRRRRVECDRRRKNPVDRASSSPRVDPRPAGHPGGRRDGNGKQDADHHHRGGRIWKDTRACVIGGHGPGHRGLRVIHWATFSIEHLLVRRSPGDSRAESRLVQADRRKAILVEAGPGRLPSGL